ncbi:MAG: ABC transporter ATP-binding protein [Oscillospiraceae bacterium]|nr:ABC transporter ATP-binding protein [Oscillospiraceae bacterium]
MILEVRKGCFAYPGQKEVLHDISFGLEKGSVLAVLGPNGIGKTTLLKCTVGLLPWKTGQSLFCGQDIHEIRPRSFWSRVSYIPQTHGFSFAYTGLEMVMLGRSAHLRTLEQPGEREMIMAEQVMERVGIRHLAEKDCNCMSGGELQMVLIARALINEPELIILDEPETGLDFRNQLLVLNMIHSLAKEEGISAIINTHYPTNALAVADESLMMNRKGTALYGPVEEVLTAENISSCFDVRAVVQEICCDGRNIRSVVPVSLAG